MMRSFAITIALVTLAIGFLHAGSASAAESKPCSRSAFHSSSPVREGSTWRMEVREDEAAYTGPSIHDRLNHNWNQTAKKRSRWTSITMPVDAGTSTELMAISAAVIGQAVPTLHRGDIVDVYVAALQGIDYSKGRAPIILRRVCGGRDVGCLDGLHRTREGSVAGVEVGGGYSVTGGGKRLQSVTNLRRAALLGGCRGEMAALSW